jgi:hypothetical protein
MEEVLILRQGDDAEGQGRHPAILGRAE